MLDLGVAVRGFLSGVDFLTLLSWDKSVRLPEASRWLHVCLCICLFCHKVRLRGYLRGYGHVSEWLHRLLPGRPCKVLRVCLVVFSPPILSRFCVCALSRMPDSLCRILDRSGLWATL